MIHATSTYQPSRTRGHPGAGHHEPWSPMRTGEMRIVLPPQAALWPACTNAFQVGRIAYTQLRNVYDDVVCQQNAVRCCKEEVETD